MSSVDCPRCEESFRVPDSPLPAGIRLRCPWCMETFPLSDLAQRLSPMAELIGEDDQPLELHSLYRETMPATNPPVGLEPSVEDVAEFEFADNAGDADQFGVAEAADFEPAEDAAAAPMDLDGSFESPSALSEAPETFEPIESYDEPQGEDFDQNQLELASEERLPVTGPVAPRPLSSVAARDFGNAGVSMAPRKRKKTSPVKSAVKMILGGVAGLAIGGAILEFAGRPLFWPFDGTISGKIKSNPPMELSDNRPARPTNSGRSLAEDLSPATVDAGPELTSSDLASDAANSEPAVNEPAVNEPTVNPIQPPAPANDAQTNDVATSDAATNPPPANAVADMQPDTSDAGDEPRRATDLAGPSDATDAATTPQPDVSELVMPVPPTTPEDSSPRDPIPTEPPSTDRSMPETPEESTANQPLAAISMPAEATTTTVEPLPAEDSPNTDLTPAAGDNSQPQNKPSPDELTTPSPATSSSVSFAPPASTELTAAIEQTEAALTKVVEFEDQSDGSGLRTSKASLYVALANLALYPQDLSQPETHAAIERIVEANLIADMKKAAPPWLRYTKRPNEGLFAAGTVVRVNNDWVLQWNGERDLQLQNFDSKSIQSGDEVLLLGRIIDANPPAIVQVVYIQKQDSP
ncbi:MAG: hypothetical protein ACO1RT_08175 [Planctomycetaceae bacterium]